MPRYLAAAIVCALLAGGLAKDAAGEIRPSFDLDTCAWNATCVVVATEGTSIDGRLSVIASWVDSLALGAELHLPELAAFAPEAKRKVHEGFTVPEDGLAVTGQRMVLFLKRDAPADPWKSASMWGDVSVSVCWIEGGEAYALMQVINPGAAVMVRLGTNEKAVRARVQQLRETKAALAAARQIDDIASRVQAATKYVDADSYLAMNEAFDVLTGCGKAAVPFLLSLTEQDAARRFRWKVFEALGAIGDPTSVEPIAHLLERELEFWNEARQKLERGWWNGKGLESRAVEHYRTHYGRVHDPVLALTKIAAPGYDDVVRRTRELWRSTPALHEIGNGQIVEACDEALSALELKRRSPK
jgi:hypothetical protein